MGGRMLVVVPVTSSEDLDQSLILCAGEQLAAFLEQRIAGAPERTEWDEELLRGLIPLDRLIREFLERTVRSSMTATGTLEAPTCGGRSTRA